MFKRLFYILAISIALSACATAPAPEDDPEELIAHFDQINNKIKALELTLAEQMAESCARNDKKLADDIAKTVIAKTRKPAEKKAASEPENCKPADNQFSLEDRVIFGAVEKVRFVKEKISLNARVDTGAVSSSLGAYRIKGFERDGKRWVRFALNEAEDARTYEYAVYGTINIKQESDEEADYRYEIRTDVRVGKTKYRKQIFNLADRSHLEYQVLIGRNFLRDIALVDISRKFVQGKK